MTTVAGHVPAGVVDAGPDVHPPLTPAQKYERAAFTFCKLGTAALIAWLVSPPIMVLAVGSAALVLYGRALFHGLDRTRCILRYPRLVMGFWAAVVAADLTWLLVLR
ncbi:MAG TPA: hypothetical protein VGA91_05640 [Candidatus Limnocylindria bacterium]|jgi:hypothetical protein